MLTIDMTNIGNVCSCIHKYVFHNNVIFKYKTDSDFKNFIAGSIYFKRVGYNV